MKKSAVIAMAVVAGAIALPAVASASNCCPGHAPTRKSATPAKKAESEKEAKVIPQTTCPVMGGKINKEQYVDHDGKRVYVCCPGCIGKIKKEPAKYIKKLEDAGVTLAKLQTTCPVMGGNINKKQYVDHDGKRVYVCCPGCIGKIKKEPAKYIKKLEDQGIVLADVPKQEEKSEKKDAHKGHNH